LHQDIFIIEHLYDCYHRDVYHFALYYTNSKQEAEDITQETFFKVMKQLHYRACHKFYKEINEKKIHSL